MICLISVPLSELRASEKPAIVLAYENTRFKRDLIAAMREQLESDGFEVKVVDHKKGGLDTLDLQIYRAVFISNSGVNSKVRPWVVEWIKKAESQIKILLHTTQRDDWEVQTTVDAVTSASNRRMTREFAEEYAEMIKQLAEKEDDH